MTQHNFRRRTGSRTPSARRRAFRLEALESRELLNADPGRLVITVDPRPMPTPALLSVVTGDGATLNTTDLPNTVEAVGNPDVIARLLGALNALPGVHAAEGRTETLALDPNDPYYANGTQWDMKGPNSINAPAAWDVTTGTTSEVVASIDTGVDYNHVDLYQNIWLNQKEIPASRMANLFDVDGDGMITFRDLNDPKNIGPGKITDVNGDGRIDASDVLAPMQKDANGKDTGNGGWSDGVSEDGDTAHVDDLVGWNFVNNTNMPLDDHGHGTHTAGTMAATGNNATGVAGVNWTAQVMALKFLAADGSGADTNAAAAVRYAADHGARVTNNSYGDSQPSPDIESAIQYAQTKGTVFVAAAGNSRSNNDTLAFYPANFTESNVVSVAATNQSGALAGFSNYGQNTVALAAPGEGITSLAPGNQYAQMSGTSMASPHVAGAIALVQSLRPDWTYSQVISDVLGTVTTLPQFTGVTKTGGVLNLGAAVKAAVKTAPAGASASFVKTDATTQGSWKGVYGADGFDVSEDPSANDPSLPSYATVALSGASGYTWAASTSDARALQKAAPGAADRVAGTWYSPSSFSADVHLTDGKAHQVALYALDWDAAGRSETVSAVDDATGTVLDTRSVGAFTGGQYLVWSVSGNVTFRVSNAGGANAVVSGLFFGGPSQPPPPVIPAAAATFLKTDATTQGSWKGVYGADGFDVSEDPSANDPSLPSYATVALSGASGYTWAASTSDARALQKAAPGAADRVAGTWYSPSSFSADVHLTDGKAHQVALYALDWDAAGRSETVSAVDDATGTVLDTRSVGAFTGGQYLVWSVSGNVTFRVSNAGGANAVVSGLFFG